MSNNKRFTDFYEAYRFLADHNMCKCEPYIKGRVLKYKANYFEKCLDIQVVKVNPENQTIENDESLNTKTEVWLEFGEAFLDLDYSEEVQFCHDCDLDCGGDTFEEAIINLANLVDEYYHDTGYRKDSLNMCDICGEEVESLYLNIETNLKGHKKCIMASKGAKKQ